MSIILSNPENAKK